MRIPCPKCRTLVRVPASDARADESIQEFTTRVQSQLADECPEHARPDGP